MLMLDVRNAITGILDRFTIADVVEVTLRKNAPRWVPLPFATAVSTRVVNGARAADSAVATRAFIPWKPHQQFARRLCHMSITPSSIHANEPEWLALVREKVETCASAFVQIVVHDRR